MKNNHLLGKENRKVMNKYGAYLYQPWLYPEKMTKDTNIPIPSEQAVDDARSWEQELEL